MLGVVAKEAIVQLEHKVLMYFVHVHVAVWAHLLLFLKHHVQSVL